MAVDLPHGIGESLGDLLATCSPLVQNSSGAGIVWVHHTGSDAYAGLDRHKPVATLAAGVALASAGDIVVMLSGHTETMTAAIEIGDLTIVGAGASGGFPTVKLTNNQAAGSLFTIRGNSGCATQLLNVWIEEQAQACSVAKIRTFDGEAPNLGYVRIRGCYIECGAHDDAEALLLGGSGVEAIEICNTTFVSVATSLTAQPLTAIACSGVSGPGSLILNGLVLDNGTVGWSNYYAMDLSDGAIPAVIGESVSLLRGADVKIPDASNGYINPQTSYGGGRIDWTG